MRKPKSSTKMTVPTGEPNATHQNQSSSLNANNNNSSLSSNINNINNNNINNNNVQNVQNVQVQNLQSDLIQQQQTNNNHNTNTSTVTGTREMSQQAVTSRQPDPDTIKMFVGQLPKRWNEPETREIFKEFGEIFTLNILRDRETNASRGCCFVTFYTREAALTAKNQLHNIKVLPGMHHPIQMKPADTDQKNEDRKLFVGMISKKMNDEQVKELFIIFGSIEECRVLRTQDGQSRGCAFVTFENKIDAQNAVKNMHQARTLEGVSSKIVVKFADTQKDKERKRIQQLSVSGVSGVGVSGFPSNAMSSVSSNLNQLGLGATAHSSLGGGNNNNLTSSSEILGHVQRNQFISQQTTANTGTMSPTSILSLMNNQLNNTTGNELFPVSGLASPFSTTAPPTMGSNNLSQALSFLTGGNSGTQTPATPQNNNNGQNNSTNQSNNVNQLIGLLQSLQAQTNNNSASNNNNTNNSASVNHNNNHNNNNISGLSHQTSESKTKSKNEEEETHQSSLQSGASVTESLAQQLQQLQMHQQQNEYLTKFFPDNQNLSGGQILNTSSSDMNQTNNSNLGGVAGGTNSNSNNNALDNLNSLLNQTLANSIANNKSMGDASTINHHTLSEDTQKSNNTNMLGGAGDDNINNNNSFDLIKALNSALGQDNSTSNQLSASNMNVSGATSPLPVVSHNNNLSSQLITTLQTQNLLSQLSVGSNSNPLGELWKKAERTFGADYRIAIHTIGAYHRGGPSKGSIEADPGALSTASPY